MSSERRCQGKPTHVAGRRAIFRGEVVSEHPPEMTGCCPVSE
jgi:hypothetical protein